MDILKIGRGRLIVPKGGRSDELLLSGSRVSDDFVGDRKQPAAEEREPF